MIHTSKVPLLQRRGEETCASSYYLLSSLRRPKDLLCLTIFVIFLIGFLAIGMYGEWRYNLCLKCVLTLPHTHTHSLGDGPASTLGLPH